MANIVIRILCLLLILSSCPTSCRDAEAPESLHSGAPISTDAQLIMLVTHEQPFTAYALFPNADSVTSGTLNGSAAHQPMVRVSMNPVAFSALEHDTLPAGASFPDGSIIFKQIITGGTTTLYALMYKDRANPLAGSGWLWAEYLIDGTIAYSVTNRGSGCVSCHSREQGLQHDYVRTFERQR
jgi:hypothetical protein